MTTTMMMTIILMINILVCIVGLITHYAYMKQKEFTEKYRKLCIEMHTVMMEQQKIIERCDCNDL